MRVNANCLKCIVDVRVKEILNSKLPDVKKFEAIKEFLRYIAEIAQYNDLTTNIGSLSFRKVKELIGDDDPYFDYKLKAEEISRELIPIVEKEASKLQGYEKFKLLVIASINANSIDPGIASYKFDIDMLSQILLDERLAINDLQAIYDFIIRSKRIVYLLDNCGEALFDMLVIRELKNLGKEVYVVVKSYAYQNDVTIKDALRIGLDKVADRLVETGSDFSSLLPGTYSEEVKKVVKIADLVIAKGMAHYETLSEYDLGKPIAFLLKAKCKPVADSLGVKVNDNIAYFMRKMK